VGVMASAEALGAYRRGSGRRRRGAAPEFGNGEPPLRLQLEPRTPLPMAHGYGGGGRSQRRKEIFPAESITIAAGTAGTVSSVIVPEPNFRSEAFERRIRFLRTNWHRLLTARTLITTHVGTYANAGRIENHGRRLSARRRSSELKICAYARCPDQG
jgi:hypothetical protein